MTNGCVFISYSSQDVKVAEVIERSLEDAGFEVWRDQSRLQNVADWSQSIAETLAHDVDAVSLVWSRAAEESARLNLLSSLPIGSGSTSRKAAYSGFRRRTRLTGLRSSSLLLVIAWNCLYLTHVALTQLANISTSYSSTLKGASGTFW
jgi:TIR domain-containing protein